MGKTPLVSFCVLVGCCVFLYEYNKMETAGNELLKSWNDTQLPTPMPAVPLVAAPAEPVPTFEEIAKENAKKNAVKALYDYIPRDWKVVSAVALDHDSEFDSAGSLRYQIGVTIEVRFQDVDGYRKRFAEFACDDLGTVIQPLSLPEP